MIFVLIAFILTALAVLILWWPLKRARRIAGTSIETFNQKLEEDTFHELAEEVSRGDLEASELVQAREDARKNLDATRSSAARVAGRTDGARAEPIGVIALTLVLAAVLAFWLFGNWRSAILGVREASHHSLVRAIDHFGAHLRQHPDDLAGWKVYARAEIVLGHYARAARAYQKLLHLPANTDRMATLADYGETLILEHPTHFDREEDRIFNQVLEAQPENSKALWYGGLLALAIEHNVPLAIQRFRHLLEDGPLPPAFAAIVRERIVALGGKIPVISQPRELRVRVGWGSGLIRKPELPATLYVYVGPDRPHAPPIWVRRVTVTRLPVTVALDASDAMRTTSGFSPSASYRVGARLAPEGNPLMGPHDFEGQREFAGRLFLKNQLIRIALVPPHPVHGP
ncbi:cytochrome c-type biogenesis protein cycH [mine drainage metagenome]|uniref:Cytochrome c-type biogenesis protein cycH n=1 Tax=mine drainage metagenome TaxID=410659 RepID=T1A084_9ZZZZ